MNISLIVITTGITWKFCNKGWNRKSHYFSSNIMKDFWTVTFSKIIQCLGPPLALQVIPYYDDIKTTNPLGLKAGNHKLGITINQHTYLKIHNQRKTKLLHALQKLLLNRSQMHGHDFKNTLHVLGKNRCTIEYTQFTYLSYTR